MLLVVSIAVPLLIFFKPFGASRDDVDKDAASSSNNNNSNGPSILQVPDPEIGAPYSPEPGDTSLPQQQQPDELPPLEDEVEAFNNQFLDESNNNDNIIWSNLFDDGGDVDESEDEEDGGVFFDASNNNENLIWSDLFEGNEFDDGFFDESNINDGDDDGFFDMDDDYEGFVDGSNNDDGFFDDDDGFF